MDRIALIGSRGCGKSTVGPLLAESLGWRFIDADVVLEANAKKTIAQIFRDDGEAAFRDFEEKNLAILLIESRIVLATGGGIVLRKANRAMLKNTFTVWLDTDAATCWQRIQADVTTAERRPNLTASGGFEEVKLLMDQRRPLYEATADLRVNGSESPQAVANAILQAWSASR